MTKLAVRRPVTTFMVILIFVVFGGMSLTNLKMDLLPNMNIPLAVVMTTYVGASPEQIQNLVSEPIEDALSTLTGLDTMVSYSSENSSMVLVQFDQSVDLDMAALDMREAVDLIKSTLPEDANDPIVVKMDINSMTGGIYLAVSSQTDDLVDLKNKVENDISNRLERQSGVASIDIMGGLEKEIRIDVLEDRIRGYGITEAQVASLVGAENTVMPIGSIEEAAKNLSIKVDGEFTDVDEIADLPITTATGATVYIRDIAIISEGYKDADYYAYLNREAAVILTIQKQSTANSVNMSDAVNKELTRIRQEYPELEIMVVMDPADYIRDSLSSVASTAVSGIILAVIVLFVFLRNVRSTLVVGSAIPLSIVVTFSFMYFANMTLNLMSLGGLTLGVGMLVDNSIVVLESIFRRIEEGESRIRAAINGAKEVAMSIVASTLTTVAVFVPVAWLGGLISQIFTDLALSISFSLAASLLVSLTFVPLACSLFLAPTPDREEEPGKLARLLRPITWLLDRLGGLIQRLISLYARALRFATTHKLITLILAGVLFVGSLVSVAGVGMELLPSADQSAVNIYVDLPQGSVMDRTQEITDKVVAQLEDVPEIDDFAVMVSGSTGQIMVTLVPMKERDKSSTQLADEIRASVRTIAGADISVEAQTSMMGGGVSGGSSAEVQYNLKGDDIQNLIEAADDMVALLRTVEGIRDPSSSVSETVPQATVKVDRMRASSYGLTGQAIMGQLRTVLSGTASTTLKRGGTEIDIIVSQGDGKISSLEDLETMLIPTATGASVPLRDVADVIITQSPMTINRIDQSTYVSVSAYLDGRDLGSVTREIESRVTSELIFPRGVEIDKSGNSQTMDEELTSLFMAFIVAIFLVYAIMAAEFESLYYPAIVMFSVPIAISTGFLGLFFMGQTLGITAALGMIMLLGIVVNNAIVLIDYINLLRGRGSDMLEAVQKAGPVRMRAILMTTLTTVLGLVPMMLGTQEGSEMMQPLATVVVWGLAFSTTITLFVVPVVYIWFENARGKLFGGRKKFRVVEEI